MGHGHGDHPAEEVLGWRRMKDRFMKEDPNSPLAPGLRKYLIALSYWPVDPAYRFQLALRRLSSSVELEMITSDGQTRHMAQVGTLAFSIGVQPAELQAYAHSLDPRESRDGTIDLFIPFRDATNGKESYGAGRYLDIPTHSLDDPVTLDFNRAYNPFCAYDEHYSCPLPPRQNWLTIRIEAGEKSFDLPELGGDHADEHRHR